MSRHPRRGPVLPAALLAAALAGPALPAEAGVEEMLVDRAAEPFESEDLHGDTVALSDFRGKVLVLNFWGIWCAPCRIEMPELEEMYRTLRSDGLEILAVNTGDPKRAVPRFVEKHELTFPVVFDRGATDLYEVIAFPTNLVLDRDGRIRFVSEGYHPRSMQRLRQVVEHLLRQPEEDRDEED